MVRTTGVFECCRGASSHRYAVGVAAVLALGCLVLGYVARSPGQSSGDAFPQPIDTEMGTMPRLTPEQAAEAWRMPEGFHATLFAGEPDVQQPIGMAFDPRGRLWVAENYTYAESGVNFDARLRDRIVILEDADGDGRAEKRTVFWDRAERLTSIELGFGGVWALCPPHLLFIPDRDGDDRPDGEPVVMLDGWNADTVRHNVVNGLRWGPDGWLYGRHGILATSRVGTPETAEANHTQLNCSIWRFHPVQRRFEVVCHGTTNPWGMDWDEHGELFFINTVIGHLWHAVPGAHFRRMYGEDFNPHVYELIDQVADHVHWNVAAEEWLAIRKGVTPETSRAGGGHAHSGLLIYQEDNWPAKYRGDVFTINFHGRRLNRDHLSRRDATYTASHLPDLMGTDDVWFRGIDLASGRDGAVYIADWSDIGECHDEDGVHRTSGRIYRIAYGAAGDRDNTSADDVSKLSNERLVRIQCGTREWLCRQARHELQARAARGDDMSAVHTEARWCLERVSGVRRLRFLWCLYVTGGLQEDDLLGLLRDDDEFVRSWAVRLLVDAGPPSTTAREALQTRALHENSGLVLTYLAATLQKLPINERQILAQRLLAHAEFADDRVLPLMIWYGIEPVLVDEPESAVALVRLSRMPKVARFIARRLTSAIDARPEGVDHLVDWLLHDQDDVLRSQVLAGMSEALNGWRSAQRPRRWNELTAQLANVDDTTQSALRELSVIFGDGRAVDELRKLAADRNQPLRVPQTGHPLFGHGQGGGAPGITDRLACGSGIGRGGGAWVGGTRFDRQRAAIAGKLRADERDRTRRRGRVSGHASRHRGRPSGCSPSGNGGSQRGLAVPAAANAVIGGRAAPPSRDRTLA